MRMHSLLRRMSVLISSSIALFLFVIVPAPAESNVAGQNVIAVSGIVTGSYCYLLRLIPPRHPRDRCAG